MPKGCMTAVQIKNCIPESIVAHSKKITLFSGISNEIDIPNYKNLYKA